MITADLLSEAYRTTSYSADVATIMQAMADILAGRILQ